MTNSRSPQFRIGNGYDIHRLVEERDLIIGGVKLHHPENLGLDGHRDADVLSHSIMDALLEKIKSSDDSGQLAAIVNEINKTRTSNIITVEDPVEFIHKDIKKQ